MIQLEILLVNKANNEQYTIELPASVIDISDTGALVIRNYVDNNQVTFSPNTWLRVETIDVDNDLASYEKELAENAVTVNSQDEYLVTTVELLSSSVILGKLEATTDYETLLYAVYAFSPNFYEFVTTNPA